LHSKEFSSLDKGNLSIKETKAHFFKGQINLSNFIDHIIISTHSIFQNKITDQNKKVNRYGERMRWNICLSNGIFYGPRHTIDKCHGGEGEE
jgi:hypothetical protein